MRFISVLLLLAMLLSFAACTNTVTPPADTGDPADTSADTSPEETTEEETSAEDTSAETEPAETDPAETEPAETEPEVQLTMQEKIVAALLAALGDEVTIQEYPEFDSAAYPGVKAITYNGADIGSNKTKVFAYIGFPEGASAENPVPAVVLVHGSQAGIPYAQWVKLWNDRGYAAISLSTSNFFPLNNTAGDKEYNGELENWSRDLYGPFLEDGYMTAPHNDGMNDSSKPYPMQWMYNALTAVIHANNLLRADERVDSEKIGITGISWGGVVTSLAIGYDNRFAFAIPVYGSGYLTEAHTVFADLFSAGRNPQYWLAESRFQYADMPILWLCMNNDAPFSLNSNSKSYLDTLPNNEDTRLSAISGWSHSHGSTWTRFDSFIFADSICKGGDKMPALLMKDGKPVVENPSDVKIDSLKLYYLTEEFAYTDGKAPSWSTKRIKYNKGDFTVELPEGTKVYYFEISYKIDGKILYTTTEMLTAE